MIDTDTYELIQMINRNNHKVNQTIQDINMLVSDIRENPKELADKLEEDKNSLAERTQSCSKCGCPLETVDKWKESRGEMLGKEIQEDMYKFGCTSCGYIKH